MLLKINLAFCIIFLQWVFVFGKFYITNDHWESEVESCWSAGEDSRSRTYNITNQSINKLPYDTFNNATIMKALGTFEVGTGTATTMKFDLLLLNEYNNRDDAKDYHGGLRLKTRNGWGTQEVRVNLTVTVSRSKEITLKVHVYAGSWGSVTCCSVKSYLYTLVAIV